MKLWLCVGCILGVAGTVWASSADRAILAAMRLGEQRNYSWTAVVIDDAGGYTIEGRTQQGGYTWVRLPMIPSIARRLGRNADVEIEAIFKGCERAVIQTVEGWRTLAELPKKHRDWNENVYAFPVTRGANLRWDIGGAGMGDPRDLPPVILPQAAGFTADDDQRPHSTAQFGLAHPHEELAVIVSSHTALHVNGDVVSGSLSDIGAQLLLVRAGQDHINPVCAAGTFKLLIKQGLVTRYLLRLEGILLVDRKTVRVRQASTTRIKDIGVTRFSVAEEARRKLGP